jgi:DNA repair exonuclease SbcCD nuclease subunit
MTSLRINAPRVGIFSDLHLGVHTNSSQWHEIALTWARWQCEEFKKHKIKDIIFCGDWHHNRSEISVNTLQVSADILDIFCDFNLILIVGNHDAYYKHRVDINSISIFKGRSNVTIVDDLTTLEAFNRKLTLCPWGCDLSALKTSDVILGHLEIESFKMTQYKVCEDGIKISDILSKSPLVISGHFHQRNEKKYNEGTVLYTGNPFQMDYGDADNAKGYYILDLNTLVYNFFENNISPKYVKVNLSELVKNENINDTIREQFRGNFIKLYIDRNISHEDMIFLTNILNQLQPLSLNIEYDINYNVITSSNIEADFSGIDIEQAIIEFVNLLDIDDKKEIVNITTALYNKCKA